MSDQEPARPKYTLPTERIAFDRQLEILRAYVSASGQQYKTPVSNSDLGQIVKLNTSTVSLANPFLREAGLIEPADGGHLPAAYTIDYARAFQWDKDTAGEKLAPAFRDSWFDQAIRPTLYIRPMTEDEALKRLADAASVGPRHRPQLRILMEYLQVSALIKREGGQVMIGNRGEATQKPAEAIRPAPPSEGRPSSPSRPGEGGIDLDVHIHASMDEIKAWQPERISAFFAGIAAVLAAKGGGEAD